MNRAGVRNYRWVVVSLIFLITLINYIDRSSVSFVIGPLKEQFHFSNTQFGMILSAFGAGYISMAVLGGWCLDRFGPRIVWSLAVLGWSLCVVLFGFAGGLGEFIALRFLLGVAEGPHFPALAKATGSWLPPGERARALSIGLVAIPLSSVIGAPICSYLVADLGWRAMFVVIGAASSVWALIWYFLFTDRPKDSRFVGKDEKKLLENCSASKSDQKKPPISLRYLLTHPALIANNVAFFASVYLINFATLWLPGYFLSQHGLDLKSVGWCLTIPWLTSALFLKAGGILSDWLLRKTGSSRSSRVHLLWSSQLLCALFFLLLSFTHTLGSSLLFMSLGIGFGMIPLSIFFNTNIEFAKERTGVAHGISTVCSSMAWIITPLLTGWTIDLTGNYQGAFLLLAGVTGAAVITVLFCKKFT